MATKQQTEGQRRRTWQGATYRASYEDNGAVIYAGEPRGNLVGNLPIGAFPLPKGECGTIDREDGGDPFERARFRCPSGRVIAVERETEYMRETRRVAEALRRYAKQIRAEAGGSRTLAQCAAHLESAAVAVAAGDVDGGRI